MKTIYTVTLNPSIDYYLSLENVKEGNTNIADQERMSLGGKGLNVSNTLSTFKVKNKAFTILAGKTGKICEEMLKEVPYEYEIIWAKKGETRINVKLKTKDKETEINGNGPIVSNEELNLLISKLKKLTKEDILILSGSSPKSLKDDIYKKILREINKDVLVIIDSNNKYLLNSLSYRPFLIKPNLKELEEIYGHKIKDDETLMKAMKYLKSLGARNVIASLGKKGAVILNDYSRFYFAKAKEEKIINSVGSGDCLVAGFIAAYLKTNDLNKSFMMAVAAGSANAYSEGFPSYKKIKEVLLTTKIDEIY